MPDLPPEPSVQPLPPELAVKVAEIQDVEAAMLQLFEHLKYPVDAQGHVLDMNHLPDVPHCLAYHLVRLGWRCHPDKALIKPRRVIGGGFYEDLVAYAPLDAPDEAIHVKPPEAQQQWSVHPTVNVIDEERPSEG